MILSLLNFFKNKTWLDLLFCILPVIIYAWAFKSIALNVNYVAFDDILILGIIPGFEDASWAVKWKRLTELFPEHRLVFSRSVILLLQTFFGKINLIWAMSIANLCWAGCSLIFYKVFKRTQLSLWYFVPFMWLWFNFQSFENIFWGVSSLCNFGVLLFVFTALYFAVYYPGKIAIALFFAAIATFTYGNGLMAFPIIAVICLFSGRRISFFITFGVATVIAIIYFIDFTPITQNLDFSDPAEVKEGFLGIFGFLGSIATLAAYTAQPLMLSLAVATGMFMTALLLFLFRNQVKYLWDAVWGNKPYRNKEALFALSLAMFVGITALALTYKRIPTDHFEGMFKGRYRMYSTICCISLYLSFLSLSRSSHRKSLSPILFIAAIGLNLVILHSNFADAVNNRRAAVAQEFNARYNADWLGTRMFSMDRAHLEKIRAYYASADPLAEQWSPANLSSEIVCDSLYAPDVFELRNGNITVAFGDVFFSSKKDYTDGAYVLLRSDKHVYAAQPNQQTVPLKTTLRRQMYFAKGISASFHIATIEPGLYRVYLLVRENGRNKIYCTGKTWKEE
ncbi:hypothetical protein [Dyadobacter psychrotolerans]|uniref:Uncharacterized protein n=1 Tax=Dyadobacter psychrotolerans TaxID=2541721 RepID=A0A4R5DE10_9BACT|nr:hypothetical protein [Dyadobacter psychrotolerans]TDE08815.1 hypothetical protein E0F88_31700 [Dyadobacter psychrotolerans]